MRLITRLLLLIAVVPVTVFAHDVVHKRQLSTLVSDCKTIAADAQNFCNAANAFTGSSSQAIAVQNAYSKLDNDIKSATTHANNSPVLSCADTQTVLNCINNTLEPALRQAIQCLVSKKSQFAAAGYQSVLCSDVRTLYTDVSNYGTALVNKACSPLKPAANSARSKCLADCQSGINEVC